MTVLCEREGVRPLDNWIVIPWYLTSPEWQFSFTCNNEKIGLGNWDYLWINIFPVVIYWKTITSLKLLYPKRALQYLGKPLFFDPCKQPGTQQEAEENAEVWDTQVLLGVSLDFPGGWSQGNCGTASETTFGSENGRPFTLGTHGHGFSWLHWQKWLEAGSHVADAWASVNSVDYKPVTRNAGAGDLPPPQNMLPPGPQTGLGSVGLPPDHGRAQLKPGHRTFLRGWSQVPGQHACYQRHLCSWFLLSLLCVSLCKYRFH